LEARSKARRWLVTEVVIVVVVIVTVIIVVVVIINVVLGWRVDSHNRS